MTSSRAEVDAIPREKRFFTLTEANATLPLVSRIVRDVTATYQDLLKAQDRVSALRGEGRTEAAELEQDTAAPLIERLQRLVDELAEVGAQLKDWEKGLVDFPAIHEGREVLLCWLAGEDSIEYWHELADGFAGRQSINVLDSRALGSPEDEDDN